MLRLKLPTLVTLLLGCGFGTAASAQGQDSTTAERDIEVIAEMLPGVYSNTNQAYFDSRLDRTEKHQLLTVRVERLPIGESHWFALEFTWGRSQAGPSPIWLLQLELRNGNQEVWAKVSATDAPGLARLKSGQAPRGDSGGCSFRWSREPAQFSASGGACETRQVTLAGLLVSTPELWLQGIANTKGETADYALHRARPFGCYVDIPGVGGGRDEPYKRYEGYQIHDAGGEFWIDTHETPSRRIGVNLLKVDWQINNYEGVFTRDVLVIYVNEIKNGERIAHGYSFTDPSAERVGINLKWLLAYCFMESNKDAQPTM